MFAQVIEARASDADALRGRMDDWDRNLKAGARGFLGSTAGVSDDGEFIVVVRFESEDDARRNSDRPEQGRWWAETEKLLEDVGFTDCTEVDLFLDGGSDDAGFVQVIRGRVRDKERYREISARAGVAVREGRPDVIGGIVAWDGSDFTQVVYFTSEAEAREGERKQWPEDVAANMEQLGELTEDVRFIDLRAPRFTSP